MCPALGKQSASDLVMPVKSVGLCGYHNVCVCLVKPMASYLCTHDVYFLKGRSLSSVRSM